MLEVIKIDQVADKKQAQTEQFRVNNTNTVLYAGVANNSSIAFCDQGRHQRYKEGERYTEKRIIGKNEFEAEVESEQECQRDGKKDQRQVDQNDDPSRQNGKAV